MLRIQIILVSDPDPRILGLKILQLRIVDLQMVKKINIKRHDID
jgi:hypothetical protein